ncbi:MAG: virB8 family protein [Rickettsiaceae bacterium]|nr:virB8 family protein [Rickettsiaceae bacterium]
MEPVLQSLKEYIESEEYFTDARKWYRYKYIYPFTYRSLNVIVTSIILIIFLGLLINLYELFPTVIKKNYAINAESSARKSAKIINANQIENNPLASITDILVRNYVERREKYNYDSLKKQFVFVKNNSTRIVFRSFYNFMNIDNASSPVLRYQKSVRRTINIISTKYESPLKAVVKFNSIAKNQSGEIIEDIIWQAKIDYEIDKINLNIASNSRFNFTITNYQLKLLDDRKDKVK